MVEIKCYFKLKHLFVRVDLVSFEKSMVLKITVAVITSCYNTFSDPFSKETILSISFIDLSSLLIMLAGPFMK
jgi:hypothetical protein